MRLFDLLSSLMMTLALLSLAACSLPSPQTRDVESNASFFVDSVKPQFTTQSTHALFSVPLARTLSIKACLKANRQSKPVINHAFEITGDDFKTQTVSTDLDGCFVINEEISYNAMAAAQSILIEREAKAVGTEKGARKIEVVVNPWSGEALSLKDTRVRPNSYVTQAQARETMKERGAPARALVLDGVRITLQPLTINGLQRKASLDMTGNLMFEGTDVNGARVTFPLSRGKFKLQYTLFYQTDQERRTVRRVIRKSAPIQVNELVQGALSVSEQFDLPAGGLCRSGVVYLGISLEPVNSPVGLKKLEGVYYYGSCETRGTSWGTAVSDFKNRFETNPALTVDQYMTEATPPAEAPAPVQTHAMELRPVAVSTISFDQSGGVLRKRNLQIQSCLRSGWDRMPVRLAELEIETMSGEKKRVMTNDEGCFIVDDQITFNYYAQECWKSAQIQIAHKATGFTQKVELHYNPWMQGDAFRDARFLDASARQLRCAQGQAEIMLSSYYFTKQQFHYKLDKHLNLEIQKQGPFGASVRLKRPSLSDPSGYLEENLPPGLYAVRLAVVDQYLRDFSKAENKVYDVYEKVLPVRAGSQIAEEILLASKNIKAIGNANQLIAEILPLKAEAGEILARDRNTPLAQLIDRSSNLKVASFRSPLNFSNNGDAGTFTQIDGTQGSVIDLLKEQLKKDEAAASARDAQAADKNSYARANRLTVMNLNDERAVGGLLQALSNPLLFTNPTARAIPNRAVGLQDLKQLVDTGWQDKLMINLCTYWFHDFWRRPLPNKNHGLILGAPMQASTMLGTECVRTARTNPRAIFDLETKYFVKNPRLVSINENAVPFRDFSISQSFSLSRGYSNSLSTSTSWSVGAGLDLLKFSGFPFSASTGVSYSVSKSESTSTGHGTSVSYSGSVGVMIETLKLNIEAPEYEKCLVVKLNPNLFVKKEEGLFAGKNPWTAFFHRDLTAAELEHFALSGYMLCEGETRRDLKTTESFYVMNQRASGAQMLDDATEANRPFFVTMRGDLDLVRFLSYLHSSQGAPASFEAEFQRSQLLSDPSQAVFIRGVKSSPGVITRIEGSAPQTN